MYKQAPLPTTYIKAPQRTGLYKVKKVTHYPNKTVRVRTLYKNKTSTEADDIIYKLERE